MSEIALYNILRRIPDTTDDEVERAVADVAKTKDVATKADIAELKTEMYRLNNRTIMWMVGVGIAVASIVIAVVG